jgi:hypothetical protein
MTNPHTNTASTPASEPHLLRLMTDLIDLMEREITVVEERLNAELPDIVARKQRLLVDYQAEFKQATHNPTWLKSLPSQQQSLLQRAGLALRDVTERNANTLKAAAAATQRLLQGIMASVREEKCTRVGYENLAQPQPNTLTQSVIFKTTA